MSLFTYAGPQLTYPFLPVPGGVAPVTVNDGDVVDLDPERVPDDGHWTPSKAKTATRHPDNSEHAQPAGPPAPPATAKQADSPTPPAPDAAPAAPTT